MIRGSFFGFGWLRPELAWLACAGLALLALGWFAVSARGRLLASAIHPRQWIRFAPRLSLARARVRFVAAALAVALLALALAGPVRGFTLREVRRRGLDIVVCVDTSRSMLVRDLRPDRITRARREVRGLIDRLAGDRMALIAFSGDAREVAPLTHDANALATLLEDVTPAENEKGGTDLGAALERALSKFDGRTGAHEAIVLLTDGEDLEGRGLEVAKQAAARSVKLFVVGMGTEAGGKIPLAKADGSESFLRDKEGKEVVSNMAGRGLDEIAQVTGGAYLPADASAAPLEELYDKRISRLEARERRGGSEYVPHDRFQWALSLAVACMLVAAGLRERRVRAPKRRVASSRSPLAPFPAIPSQPAAPVAPVATLRAVLPLALVFAAQAPPSSTPAAPVPAAASPASTPAIDRRGAREVLLDVRRDLQAERFDDALRSCDSLVARADAPAALRGEVEFHRGLVLERQGDRPAAATAFARAGGLCAPGPLRLAAWYDAGTVELGIAEELFLRIPEVRKARGMPALPAPSATGASGPTTAGTPGPGAAPGAAAPSASQDPNADLDQASDAYRVAQTSLVLRLRAERGDEDTRANLELIRRRLRQLDELRRQREEQKPEPKEDPQSQDSKDGEPPKDSKDGEPPKDPKDEPQDPSKQDPKPSEPPKPTDPKDEAKPEDAKESKPESSAPQDPAQPGEERELSKEEVLRLLDQLQAIEQEARELEAKIRARRRAPVEKDW